MKLNNIIYYEFEKNDNKWVLPVYKDSVMHNEPNNCFSWDKEIKFIREVTEKEYNEQFTDRKELQQEFEF